MYNYSEHLSLNSNHGEIISDELAQKLAVAGTPAHCAQRLQEFDDLGIDQITISLLSGDREQRIRTIEDTIIPGLD